MGLLLQTVSPFDKTAIREYREEHVCIKKSAFILSYLHTSQVCYINIGDENHFHCFDRVIVVHI